MGVCISQPLAICLPPSPGPGTWPPALASNLYLPALAYNLYLPALAPNITGPLIIGSSGSSSSKGGSSNFVGIDNTNVSMLILVNSTQAAK